MITGRQRGYINHYLRRLVVYHLQKSVDNNKDRIDDEDRILACVLPMTLAIPPKSWVCNNVTSGEVPKRKSRDNNLGLHPGRFDLFRNASPSRAPIWSRDTFFPTHSSPYALISLRTRLTVTSVYQPEEHFVGIYLRSSTCRGVILDRRSTRRGSWAVGWTQSTLLPCVVVSLVSSQPE